MARDHGQCIGTAQSSTPDVIVGNVGGAPEPEFQELEIVVNAGLVIVEIFIVSQ